MSKYPRLRNGKLEGVHLFPHVVDEENKVVWVRVTSAITAMGLSAFKKRWFPEYDLKIATAEYWDELQKN